MHDSPHASRWINSLAGREWDLHLFPTASYNALPELRGVTLHRPFLRVPPSQLRELHHTPFRGWWKAIRSAESALYPHPLGHDWLIPLPIPHRVEAALDRIRLRTGESDARSSLPYGPRVLARLIRKLKPDLIHSMEFQHCGYRVLKAREIIGPSFPPWLATNWGSDIFLFRHDAGHRAQIQRLLKYIDFYSCECQRDLRLARELGMIAHALPVMPNSGGFDLPWVFRQRSRLPPSRRRLILVKGYQHFAGRALTALAALERCADLVKDFDVVIFSSSREAIRRAAELRRSTPIKSIIALRHVTHEQMLRLHALARVYLGVSISDAISTSALEAMAMGAFPIQTDTSCCDEWFEHGRGGYLIPQEDVDAIAARLRTALTDDALVDRAAEINWRVVETRLDERKLTRQIWDFYDELFECLDQSQGARASTVPT
jgi:hypothetical protein